MKRTDIELRVKGLATDMRAAIGGAPLQWFFTGILLGIVLAAFSRLFVPLIFIFLIVAVVFWFLADDEGSPE